MGIVVGCRSAREKRNKPTEIVGISIGRGSSRGLFQFGMKRDSALAVYHVAPRSGNAFVRGLNQ